MMLMKDILDRMRNDTPVYFFRSLDDTVSCGCITDVQFTKENGDHVIIECTMKDDEIGEYLCYDETVRPEDIFYSKEDAETALAEETEIIKDAYRRDIKGPEDLIKFALMYGFKRDEDQILEEDPYAKEIFIEKACEYLNISKDDIELP